ncbi:MAG: alpha/beta hydrolase [Clostridia bacterium]|nr:alpha/beta hydrolase [Clostridia bacterium]
MISTNKKKNILIAVIAIFSVIVLLGVAVLIIYFVPTFRIPVLKYFFEMNERKIMKSEIDSSDLDVLKDIKYVENGDSLQTLDIYKLKGLSDDAPVFVCIHGGGLFACHKETNIKYCYDFARKGFAVVSINYRLIPNVTLYDQINDCITAFKYIEANKETYKLNLDNAFLAGDSAGALLTYFSSIINANVNIQNEFEITGTTFQFKKIALVSIMYDTNRSDAMDFVELYLANKEGEAKAYFKYLKDPTLLLDVATFPSAYLVTSDQDSLQKESLKLHDLLTQKGIEHQFKNYPKVKEHTLDHVFAVKNPQYKESQEVINGFKDFFLA